MSQVRDPHPDEPFFMPTPESQRRLANYLNALEACGSPEFAGCVLMSLLVYVDDEIWQEAIADALKTCSPGAQA